MLGPRTLEKRKALRVLIHAGNTARDRGLAAVPEDVTADIPRRHHHIVRTTSISAGRVTVLRITPGTDLRP